MKQNATPCPAKLSAPVTRPVVKNLSPSAKPRPDKRSPHPSPSTATLAAASTILAPVPRRDDSGEEHTFFRLFNRKNTGPVGTKGKQRLTPLKKRFTSLKKKVLQERLDRWRASHSSETTLTTTMCTVCIHGLVELEELQDDDEYDEILSNLKDMSSKVGAVRWCYIPRTTAESSATSTRPAAFVEFSNSQDGVAAVACWNNLVLGGQTLAARTLSIATSEKSQQEWQELCKDWIKQDSHAEIRQFEVVVENVLTEDDLEDEDCLEESIHDIRSIAERFGKVLDVRLEREPRPVLHVQYAEQSAARLATSDLAKLVVGGSKLQVKLVHMDSDTNTLPALFLDDALTEDDLEDEECLTESLADLRELAERFGRVEAVVLDPDTGRLGVKVTFRAIDSIQTAKDAFHGMKIGGATVTARASGDQDEVTSMPGGGNHAETPMYSGDKLISERFAECKRAPKIPGPVGPRHYATLCDDETVKPLLIEMIGELARLQKRAVADKNAKARRRLVMGLREVARGLRAHKVKMVVCANNLDQYGVIDEKLQEILDLTRDKCVPIFFEFNKRTLGKAIGKSIKIAIVGIQNADGAHQAFKRLSGLAPVPTEVAKPSPDT